MSGSKPDIPSKDDRWTRWSLFLGILVWFVDLNTVYALPSLACTWGWFSSTIAGIPGLVLVEGTISLVSMLLIVLLIYLAWKYWHQLYLDQVQEGAGILTVTAQDRRALTAFVAILVNGFFLLFMFAMFVPLLALNACARG